VLKATVAPTVLLSILLIFIDPLHGGAQPAMLRVFVANGVKDVVQDLRGDAEHAARVSLSIQSGEAALLERALKAGEVFDVAILPAWAADELVSSGRALPVNRFTFARAAIGLAVPSGAIKPRIDTADAFRRAMLTATSVAVSGDINPGSARLALDRAFQRLGIAEEMKSKTLLTPIAQAVTWVADRKAQYVISYVSNILAVRGVELVGRIPEEVQSYIDFDAISSATSTNSEAVGRLLTFLAGPHEDRLRAHGNEPRRR
jgi:molybdate transport system substrate-binding protein